MNFTDRMGIEIPKIPIRVRYEVPEKLRLYLLQLMIKYEKHLSKIREYVCDIVKQAPDPNQWGENEYMKKEIIDILMECRWNRVYGIAEHFYQKLSNDLKGKFEKDLNEYFVENGIGWKLTNGIIETRGEEEFEQQIKEVVDVLGETNMPTAQNEIREAIKDLSRKPEPEITGSIQHSGAALECLAREVTNDKNETLGRIIKNHKDIVPVPLDKAVDAMWGFASNHARHLSEGNSLSYEEAELIVHLTASLCTYLAKKHFPQKQTDDI